MLPNEEFSTFAALKDRFAKGETRSEEFRREQLNKLQRLIEEHRTEIEQALAKDLRKSSFDAEISEIGVTLSEIRHAQKSLRRWMKPRCVSTPLLLQPARSRVRPEPVGVVLIISPWNYPLNLLFGPLVGALAAGNCVVLKPSELAPATSTLLTRLVNSTFAADVVRAVEGGREETTRLLALPFDHIFFTGSTEVGRVVMQAAAKNLVPVTLELGGKSPCFVLSDADLKISARRIAWGKFLNVGQTCVAPDYVLVDAQKKAAFLEELSIALREFWGQDPRTSPDYGRIINSKHYDRLVGLLNESLRSGARTVVGGQTESVERYIAPTVLDHVTWESPVMREEIFGPLLPVIAFDTLEEAMAQVRNRPRPLALYVFTDDETQERAVTEGLSFGGGCVNDTIVHLGNLNLPFGGIGASGMGAYHGDRSFEVFSHFKALLRRPFRFDVKVRYPPHSANKLKLVRWLRTIFG